MVSMAAARRRSSPILASARKFQESFTSERAFQTTRPQLSTDERETHRNQSLFTLVSMIEKIKQYRRMASEEYVIRYLETSFHLSSKQLDAFLDSHNRHYNTPLSVKRDLEPVALFLLSTGLSKAEVASVAVRAPLLFRKRVDELFLFFEWLSESLGSEEKARAVLLRKPESFVVDSLDAFSAGALGASTESDNEGTFF